jgi:hypothetical protein
MINRIELSQAEKDLIAQYNIKVETRTLFYSEGYKYDNLKDALSYARLSIEKKRASGEN